MRFINRISILFVLVCISAIEISEQIFDDGIEEYTDEDTSAMNESLANSSSTTIQTSITTSLSPIIQVLSTKHKSVNRIKNNKNRIFLKNRSTPLFSSSTPRETPMTEAPVPPDMLANFLVDQFNDYRNIDILSHVKQCDSQMKLNDICERYSFDNLTYSLIRQSNIEFQSLEHLYDALVDRMIVQQLNSICLTGQWCLANLTEDDIRFTINVVRQRGRSFCSLEKCYDRLSVYATACPSISTKNITTPTLKLLPMFCALYNEQQSWSSIECIDQIGYLLHILYAFWSQIETCYHIITGGSGGCTPECLTFDTILHEVENQCNQNASFLTRVPALAWYRLTNLREVCRQETTVTKPSFMDSIKSFISSQMLWYQSHQRAVYAALFIIIVICIVISFSLCLYVMSGNDYDSNTRRFEDDDYEYTRLHDSTFELGSNTDISNTNLSSSRVANGSPFDLNGNHRLSEQQRLL